MNAATPNLEAKTAEPDIRVSFEFFPPKTDKMAQTLWTSIGHLAPYEPHFVSVTYGAGGSTRERTHATVERILKETTLTPAAHLTCVGATRGEVDSVIRAYKDLGVKHIVAIRGDPPSGVGMAYQPHPGGYANAAELVAGIGKIGGFEISVSGYPECHPESENPQVDLDMVQAKVDAGATRAITQFFFENDYFYRYLERVRSRGIEIPIRPGLIPIHNFKQVAKFAESCGASVPAWLAQRFEGLDDDDEARFKVAAEIAAEQALALAEQGIDEFHFFTLNRAPLVDAVCQALGLRAQADSVRERQAS
jgi:methylenetetrahydrofolate reductase (NADPH)